MPVLDINLNGDNAWPDLHGRNETTGLIDYKDPISVAVLSEGMESGKPSVAFRFDLPGGMVVIAQTSGALVVALARMLKARFPDIDA